MDPQPLPIRGRGAAENPAGRFERLTYEPDPDAAPDEAPAPGTQFYRDQSRSIIAYNDSPDIIFGASINPYRGCEVGCSYCYARPYHEYLGLSPGLDFETKVLVKEDAPRLLRQELLAKTWQPQLLGLSGVTDCYQPVERRLQLTRRCLEVLAEFRNPVSVVTKNALVARDADLLAALARSDCAMVFLSITTLDADLAGKLEPRAARPLARLGAIKALAAAGVPVGVLVAPVIPGLNDHEMPAIIAAAAQAGARYAGWTLLRLPLAVGPLFTAWLERHFPQRKDKVLGRVRDLRGGKLNNSRFRDRMRGQGPVGDLFQQMFDLACQQAGLRGRAPRLSTAHFQRPGQQRGLFDGLP